ncbi:unnamed protein product [Aphanomyces euteiches]|nr:hypothetical protein Ae201684P_009747 [Aphanomyces euteiches]KAH9139491.1 hypothetical protein AeRB84_016221 [Aphanomyces euteiches]
MGRGAIKVDPRTTALRRASSCSALPNFDEQSLKAMLLQSSTKWEACTACGKEDTVVPCTWCKTAMYCSESCQTSHASVHRLHCKSATQLDDKSPTDNNSARSESFVSSPSPRTHRNFSKHALKKIFALPSLVTSALEKRKKGPPVACEDVACLEDRPPSPIAVLEEPEQQSPEQQSPEKPSNEPWSVGHPDFIRCKFVVWHGGVPGFHVGYDPDGHGGLVVDAITGPFAWSEGICVGDKLELIGGVSVADMDPHGALALLRMSDIPTVLRFRSPEPVTTEIFEVPLQVHEKLGVTFAADGLEAIPVVNRITDRTDTLARTYNITCGAVLVCMDSIDAISLGLAGAMGLLARRTAPMVLQFQRRISTPEPPSALQLPPARSSTFLSVSSVGRDSPRLSIAATTIDESRGELFIVWRHGPLGLTLIPCPETGLPKVNRLTGKGRSALIDRVQHGYSLVSINGDNVEPGAFQRTCDRLHSLEKPLLLLFRPPPASPSLIDSFVTAVPTKPLRPRCYTRRKSSIAARHLEYEVLWERAPLGLVLGTGVSLPFVKRIKPDCSLRLKRNIVGDQLVAVNNFATRDLAAQPLASLLRCAVFPAVLRFRRVVSSENEQENDEAGQWTISDDSASDDELPATFTRSFNVVWQGGDLGITFECVAGAISVKRIAPLGCARRTNMVLVGDILVSINGRRLPMDQPFKDTMTHILSLKKPVILGFERDSICFVDDDIEDDNLIHSDYGPTQL